MFCPICKAEYRLGFIRCSDCDVDLVEKLPGDRDDSASPTGVDAETGVALWEGTDINTFAAIRMVLNDAGIFHKESEAKSPLWRTVTRPPLAIWIQRQDEEAARKILADVCGDSDSSTVLGPAKSGTEPEAKDENTGQEIPLHEDDSAAEPAPDDIPEDFDPLDATREVWSGEDKQMAEYLKMSLNENGIGWVAVDEFGKQKVRVLPAAEARATEIVRQVVDGIPPQ
jgi:hypothetical protein